MIDTGGGLDRLHISPQSNPPVPEDGKEKHSLSFIHEAPSKRFVFQITHTMEKKNRQSTAQTRQNEREGNWKTLLKYLYRCTKVQLLTERFNKNTLALNHDHLRLFPQTMKYIWYWTNRCLLSCCSFAGHMRWWQLVPRWRQTWSWTG